MSPLVGRAYSRAARMKTTLLGQALVTAREQLTGSGHLLRSRLISGMEFQASDEESIFGIGDWCVIHHSLIR